MSLVIIRAHLSLVFRCAVATEGFHGGENRFYFEAMCGRNGFSNFY